MSELIFSKKIETILSNIDLNKLGKNVAIKVHFGEKGCNTFIPASTIKKIYDAVINSGRKATLVECNVLYKGSRTNATDHLKTAHDHGFNFAPIDILDGEKGDECIEIKTKNTITKIGSGLKKYDSMIVVSHFKGHGFAGFGAAIKNVGMGLGSRAGKMHMHTNVKPKINAKCIGCKSCYNHCPVKAITYYSEAKVCKIDHDVCIGCAMCIAVCNYQAVNIPWGSATTKELHERIAQYCEGVFGIIPKNKIIFINLLENITKECDCMGISQKLFMEDIGVLAGEDIVAIDFASLEFANKESKNMFDKINSVDNNYQINYAESIGIGSKKYKIKNLDK
jgi:uncharacterized Fe-S center protein